MILQKLKKLRSDAVGAVVKHGWVLLLTGCHTTVAVQSTSPEVSVVMKNRDSGGFGFSLEYAELSQAIANPARLHRYGRVSLGVADSVIRIQETPERFNVTSVSFCETQTNNDAAFSVIDATVRHQESSPIGRSLRNRIKNGFVNVFGSVGSTQFVEIGTPFGFRLGTDPLKSPSDSYERAFILHRDLMIKHARLEVC